MSEFEKNQTKIIDVRVPHWKTAKKAITTSSKQTFQNLSKVSSQICVDTMWSKFQQKQFQQALYSEGVPNMPPV